MNEALAVARTDLGAIGNADEIVVLVVAKAAVKVLSWGNQERLDEFSGLQSDERRCGRLTALFAPAI
jgi:hypothetical protein